MEYTTAVSTPFMIWEKANPGNKVLINPLLLRIRNENSLHEQKRFILFQNIGIW